MRTVDLGRTAAQAEVLRIKRVVHRQVGRVVLALIAAVFLVAVLVMIHVVAYLVIRTWLIPIWDTAAILAFDLVMALLLGGLALRDTPDPLEIEARLIRDQALGQMKQSLTIMALLAPLMRLLARSGGRKDLLGMAVAALTTAFLSKHEAKNAPEPAE
jgi:hypothetical protein